ncbi:MAG: hypothetical protein Kow0029_05640 [Candidatus Rifleibacteriota bacterium]
MGRAAFVTPVYFFSSIRTGSGKSSLVANFAIYQNSCGKKVAIIDLDFYSPQKLKNVFPQAVVLNEYADLQKIQQASESRYQKSFYFTDTDQISYFPAMHLQSPELLFHDAALRDFFLQARATFDSILINFPPGDKHALQVSELLSQKHLWHGCSPDSIIISTSDTASLIKLDGIMRKSPALPFHLRENTLILFNRVPGSLEEQKFSDSALNVSELKKLFGFQNVFYVGHNEEFSHQKNIATPIVLNSESLLHQSISRLSRILGHKSLYDEPQARDEGQSFSPCLDGALLEKLSPYLDEIKAAAATRFIANPHDVQVFLEESQGLYRIRVRLTGQRQKSLGIISNFETFARQGSVIRPSPENFDFLDDSVIPETLGLANRENISAPSVKPIYQFDDRFSGKTKFELFKRMEYETNKGVFPSPIIFRHNHQLPEIPSLSHILGFVKKSYKKFTFVLDSKLFLIPGVTHFFIPPEFELSYKKNAVFSEQSFIDCALSERSELEHEIFFTPAYELNNAQIELHENFPDYFARCKQLSLSSNFTNPVSHERNLELKPVFFFTSFFSNVHQTNDREDFFNRAFEIPASLALENPAILQLYEPSTYEEINQFKKIQKKEFFFEKRQLSFEVDKTEIDFNLTKEALLSRKIYDFCWLSTRAAISCEFDSDTKKIVIAYQTRFVKNTPNVPSKFLNSNAKLTVASVEPSLEQTVQQFKLDPVLLEHSFLVQIDSDLHYHDEINTRKFHKSGNFDFHFIFKQSYLEFPYNKPEIKTLQKQPNALKHRFGNFAQAFKNIAVNFPLYSGNHRWDILQISLISAHDKDYRKLTNQSIYSADQLLTKQLEWKSLPPIHSKMLELQKPKIVKSSRANNRKSFKEMNIRPAMPKYIQKPLLGSRPERILPEFLEVQRKRYKHKFNEDLLVRYSYSYLSGEEVAAESTKPDFKIRYLTLFTLPYHSFKSCFLANKPTTELNDFLKPVMNLFDSRSQPSLSKEKPVYYLEPYEIILPRKLPMRIKILDSRLINITNKKADLSEIPELKKELEILKDKANHTNLLFRTPETEFRTRKPQLESTLPFFKPLIDATEFSNPVDIKFHIPPPDAINEIYNHLLYLLKADLAQRLEMIFKPFAIKPINFKLLDTSKKLNFQEGIFFVRRILQSPEKMSLPIKRNCFKIVNPKLKDLFKLARQTSKKFMEVNNKAN